MFARLRYRFLTAQFGRPRGAVGRWLIGPWLDRISRAMNELTLQQLQLRRKDDVLEIGFGGGALLRSVLRATTGKVTGVELSDAMLARSRRKLRREIESARLTLANASAETLPLEDGSVDKACSVNSIYFWPDPERAMAELARVIRPGGRLVLCFEPPEELRKWPGHEHGFRLWRGDEVAHLIRSAGFGKIEAAWGHGRKPDLFLCLSAERSSANGASHER